MTDEVVRLDAYVEGVLAGRPAGPRPLMDPADIDPAAGRAADILARSLVRFHPSFRFEDALAARLRALGEAMHDERPEPLIGGPLLAFPGATDGSLPGRADDPAGPLRPRPARRWSHRLGLVARRRGLPGLAPRPPGGVVRSPLPCR